MEYAAFVNRLNARLDELKWLYCELYRNDVRAFEYFVDMLVDEKLIVELKATKALAPEHLAQTLNYLKITGFPVGLLINFGSYKFERRTVTSST